MEEELKGILGGLVTLINIAHDEARRAYWFDRTDCGCDWHPEDCHSCNYNEQCKAQVTYAITLEAIELLLGD